MLYNCLVAFSNIVALAPLHTALQHNDYGTLTTIGFVASMSFLSHLVENHKHGMKGIGFSQNVSYILNRLDVLGCVVTSSWFTYLYVTKYGYNLNIVMNNKLLFLLYASPIILLRISEYDKYNAKHRNMYIVSHIMWHASIFYVMNHFMTRFIY